MKKVHLILGIGYAVYGALILAFIAFQLIALVMLFSSHGGQEPIQLLSLVPLAFFLFLGLILITIASILAYLLFEKKNRIACIVLAGILCIGIPIGPILGIITIIMLTRPSIKEQFTA